MRRVMEECFADPPSRRVVVEPDVRNDKIAALNAAVGFVVVRAGRAARQDRGAAASAAAPTSPRPPSEVRCMTST